MMRSTIDQRTAWTASVLRLSLPLLAASLCAGCGLAGTTVATGVGASAEVQQAQQAKQTEDRVQQQVEAAKQAAAKQLNDAEAQSN